MFILAGKSCAGKNAIADELLRRGYERCITYTTRPIREKEVDGVDYHFVSDEQFQKYLETGFFAEYIKYTTVFGEWWYGTAAKDFEEVNDKKFIILTPEGIAQIKNVTGLNPKVIYIHANPKTINKRLKDRGDNKEEADRRMEQDTIDFKGFEKVADKIYYNNLGTNISDVADKIERFVTG